MGDLSLNFSRREFVCKHCRLLPHLDQDLVDMLQHARSDKGVPLRIVSGYRCEVHNRAVGGSKKSQHMEGRAADVPPGYATADEWWHAGAIGIGVRRNLIIHINTKKKKKPFVFND